MLIVMAAVSACHSCQAVDHPYLVVHSAAATAAGAAAADVEDSKAGDLTRSGMCGLCHDPLEQPMVASCGHVFCRVRQAALHSQWACI